MTLNNVIDQMKAGSKSKFVHNCFAKNNTEYIYYNERKLIYKNIAKDITIEMPITLDVFNLTCFLKKHVCNLEIINYDECWDVMSDKLIDYKKLIEKIYQRNDDISNEYGISSFVIADIVEKCSNDILIDIEQEEFNKENMGLSTKVNVIELMNVFKGMADRGTLLAESDKSRQDLLIQIYGVIMKVASDKM